MTDHMAGYVEKTLAPGEDIVYRANFNWTYSFFPVFWFALGSAPVVMYLMLQYGQGVPAEDLRAGWYFVGGGFIAGSVILINHMIKLWTTEFVVTNSRFVFKTGLLARHTQEVSLNKIEEIKLQQSVWGRLFGYGSLSLHGTGVGLIKLPNIDNPIHVRRIIETAKADLRGRRSNHDDED
ncbi:MAG: PH domain-containing protein [Parvularculaceae bacterium]